MTRIEAGMVSLKFRLLRRSLPDHDLRAFMLELPTMSAAPFRFYVGRVTGPPTVHLA